MLLMECYVPQDLGCVWEGWTWRSGNPQVPLRHCYDRHLDDLCALCLLPNLWILWHRREIRVWLAHHSPRECVYVSDFWHCKRPSVHCKRYSGVNCESLCTFWQEKLFSVCCYCTWGGVSEITTSSFPFSPLHLLIYLLLPNCVCVCVLQCMYIRNKNTEWSWCEKGQCVVLWMSLLGT